MKKCFLLLTMLFPLATLFSSGSANAADPDKSEYEAAMAAITDGIYYLMTNVDGIKYYVTRDGGLTKLQKDRGEFYISKVDASAAEDKLYDIAFLIDPGTGSHFSNTTLIDDKTNLHPGSFCLNEYMNRNDWERQVFYLNNSGKFAIRTCNTIYGETKWKDAGRVFWTYEVAESNIPTPCYSYDPAYIWELEASLDIVQTTINGVHYNIDYKKEVAQVICLFDNAKYNGDIVIPNSIEYDDKVFPVTSIGVSAFRDCTDLTSITIPNSVTSIGIQAFSGCSSLKSIIIPNSVTSIGDGAFYGCTSLTSVTLNSNAIVSATRSSDSSMKDIFGNQVKEYVIGDGVTSIGSHAFDYCSSLTSVTIPNSLTNIGGAAFYACTGLTSINIPNSVTTIGGQAFQKCSSLTSATIGSGVTNLGGSIFSGCTNLTSVTLNNNVIASAPRSGSYSMKNIFGEQVKEYVIGDDVTIIGSNAFCDCSGLTSITIPSSLKRVMTGAFKNCTSLSKVIVTDIAAWCDIIYEGDDSNGDFPLGIAQHLYNDENTEITEIIIPEGVTKIHSRAFRDAKYVTSVVIPNSVTYIGSQAFRGMNRLTSINIPEGVTKLYGDTFSGCCSLTSITIPQNVSSIESGCFWGNRGLMDVWCYANNVPSTNSGAFNNTIIGLVTLHVPASSVASYKATAPWNGFGTIVGIGEDVNTETIEIASAEDLANFASRVNGGETSLSAVLKADIDFTAYTNTMIGLNGYYRGEFDGAGHTIKLGLNRSSENAALFCGLSGYVHDLTTTGTITTSAKYAAGIAANTANATIERCQSGVKIISSVNGDGTHGGIIGISSNTIVRDCLFSGSITGSQTNCCGGVSGWAEGINTFTNCLIKSTFTVGTSNSELLSRNPSNVISSNNYFQGSWGADNNCGVTLLTEEQVKSGEACYLLNNGRTGEEMVWYQTLGEDDLPIPDSSHMPVWFVGGSYMNNSQFTITFDTNGGSPIEAITQDYGSTITPPEAPTREGYTFLGWEPAIPETMPLGGLTVVAQWQINSYTLTYKVDDEVYKTFEVEYGSTITPEAAPTKEGYTFSGWSEIPETMPANDVVVTGTFTVNKYNLTYKVDGEVYKTYEVAFGSEIIPEPAPTKEGHTFGGWSEIPATMPAHDVEVTGTFTVNSYFLFYVLDGSIYKACGVQYGAEIVPEADPEKEGYTFSGWEGLPETMPAHDVTVQGSFTINSYTLTYLVDGEEYKTETLVYGTEITPEAEPSKEGYTFSGWSEIPETMPAQDVTITGSFTVNSYTLSYIVDGEVYKTFEVVYGSTITPEAEPMKAGYTFSGWSEIPETMPANDVEVTGSFILKMAESIALDMESLLFNSIDAQQLNVTLTPSDLINNTISWSSTDIEVATVDETGLVTPVGNGEAYIIACTTDGTELKDSCMVTVDFKAATLAIDKESVKFTKLKRKKLTAIVTPDKASQEVTWSSSDASIVTVSETGTITPLRNGKAIITATTTDGTELSATCTVTVSIPSQFEVAVTQTTFTIQSNSETSEAMNIKATIDGEVYDLGDEGKLTGLAPGRTYHVEVNADIDGYNWTEELDVTMAEIAVNFEGKTSPTTLDISAVYDAGDATVTSASFEGEENVSSLNLIGLEPGQTYNFTYSINTEEGGTYTYETQFTTETLALNISRTKVVSVGNVVVVASSNITEEENVSVGFEWRRYDWPDEIQTKTGAAYIYAGTIEGSIKNLNADKFWKIRPYFLSQAGNRFLGDWVTIDPSDVSYFEPSVHTYNSISVEGNTAEVKGFVMQGSDDVESQGFMYWENTPSSSSRRNANGVPVDAKIVKANGNMMVASLEDLEFETNYCYVAFAKTSEGEIFYGEQQTFTTGEMDPDGINEIKNEKLKMNNDSSWFTIDGRKLDKPQKGINIIRYADGTTKKVVIK